jgi:hypothetical protein
VADVLERLQTKALNPLDMASIVGQEGQIMPQRSCSDQEIEVADKVAGRAECSTRLAERLTGDALVELGEGDHRDAEPFLLSTRPTG